MDARQWWTVILTALAGPVGSVGLGLGLARWAEATTGGMAVLAGGVVGLWLGAPLMAFIVFGVCLVWLLRHAPLRRGIALLMMFAAVIVEAFLMLIGLRLVAGSSSPEVGLVIASILALGVLGAGAYVALRLSHRRITAEPAD
ncbi:MAG: hypothetical protein RL134_349 [Actinomycetota bacterium]|jgi:hypothetical protein